MPRPGQLAQAIAESLGEDETTIRQKARVLRDEGLMAKEKGGRGAGSMGTVDACTLLVASAGTAAVNECHYPVVQHGKVRCSDGTWPSSSLPELASLPDEHRFIEALEAILRSMISGNFQRMAGIPLEAPIGIPPRDAKESLAIRIYEPLQRSSIALTFPEGTIERRYFRDRSKNLFDPPFSPRLSGDLSREHSFTHVTLLRIADLFRH